MVLKNIKKVISSAPALPPKSTTKSTSGNTSTLGNNSVSAPPEVVVKSTRKVSAPKPDDTMRGLFFIVKGRHVRKIEPEYTNRVTNEVGHLGGYDPRREETEEWYNVLDRKSFHCVYCGDDYEKAVGAIVRTIVRYKGVAKNYFREVSRLTSDDYYEVHYLGHEPLTPEKRTRKCEGRCPRTSPIMQDMYKHIDMFFGDYFAEVVDQAEDRAYEDLVEQRPVNKSRKIFQKVKSNAGVETPVLVKTQTPVITEDTFTTPKKLVKRPVKLAT